MESGGDEMQNSEVTSLRCHAKHTYSSSNKVQQHIGGVSAQGSQLESQSPGLIERAAHIGTCVPPYRSGSQP